LPYLWENNILIFVDKLPQMNHNLEFLGFSPKENTIYQTVITLGSATAKDISKTSGFDRTTIYDILAQLEKRGLVYKQQKTKVLHFSAHNPKNLLTELHIKEDKLTQLLPDLENLFNTSGYAPLVRTYEGSDQLINLYESILGIPKLKNYDIICSEQDWLQLNPNYFKKFKKKRAALGINTRLIMETSVTAERRKQEKIQTASEVKLLPPAFSPLSFTAGCYILQDRVIFISYRKEHLATEIFSKEITNFMQNIFNFMWKTLN
jgi:sugar-specific transcriptional regulator TrmB